MGRNKMSLRARTLNGDKLKVNDKRGNPIEIAAVVVWRVEGHRASQQAEAVIAARQKILQGCCQHGRYGAKGISGETSVSA